VVLQAGKSEIKGPMYAAGFVLCYPTAGKGTSEQVCEEAHSYSNELSPSLRAAPS
jgi:hypothetical protein